MKKILITLLLLAVPSMTLAFDVNLKPGARGEEVKKVQKFLGVDQSGFYGNLTKKAVAEFQKSKGLPASGLWLAVTRGEAKKQNVSTGKDSLQAASSTVSKVETVATSKNDAQIVTNYVSVLNTTEKCDSGELNKRIAGSPETLNKLYEVQSIQKEIDLLPTDLYIYNKNYIETAGRMITTASANSSYNSDIRARAIKLFQLQEKLFKAKKELDVLYSNVKSSCVVTRLPHIIDWNLKTFELSNNEYSKKVRFMFTPTWRDTGTLAKVTRCEVSIYNPNGEIRTDKFQYGGDGYIDLTVQAYPIAKEYSKVVCVAFDSIDGKYTEYRSDVTEIR